MGSPKPSTAKTRLWFYWQVKFIMPGVEKPKNPLTVEKLIDLIKSSLYKLFEEGTTRPFDILYFLLPI